MYIYVSEYFDFRKTSFDFGMFNVNKSTYGGRKKRKKNFLADMYDIRWGGSTPLQTKCKKYSACPELFFLCVGEDFHNQLFFIKIVHFRAFWFDWYMYKKSRKKSTFFGLLKGQGGGSELKSRVF